jgi:hypothetical protein
MTSVPIKKKLKRPEQHYDMVEVIWDDAAGFRDGWKDKADPIEPQLALSVGFLVVDDPEHIILASDTDERGAHNGRTQIPRGMVKRIKMLRKRDKKMQFDLVEVVLVV